jgi:hypothetical protein
MEPMAPKQTTGKSKARLIAMDFARSVLFALSIGVVTSLALGSAVLLIAQSAGSGAVVAEATPPDR